MPNNVFPQPALPPSVAPRGGTLDAAERYVEAMPQKIKLELDPAVQGESGRRGARVRREYRKIVLAMAMGPLGLAG